MSGASETDIESLIDIARTFGTDDPERRSRRCRISWDCLGI